MIKLLIDSIPLQYYAFSGLVNFLTAGVIALAVFLSNKKSKTNRVFSLFSLAVSYWSLFYFIWLNTKDEKLAEFYLRTCMIGVLFMPSLFIHFVNLFLNIRLKKKFIIFNYILSILFTLTVYTSLYAKDIGRHLVFPYWLHTGPIFHLALIHFGTVVLYSFVLMWKAINREKGIFRNQILYVFTGTAIGYVAGVTNFFCWYRIEIPPFLNIFVSVYVILVAVAILRYRLLDINIALTRAGIFTIVYGLVLGIPFLLGYKYGLWQLATWITVFLATLGPFIYQSLRRHAEDIILRDQRRYQHALRELSKTMTRIRDLDQLIKTITSTVIDTVKVSFVAIYIKDEQCNSYRLRNYHPQAINSNLDEFISSGHDLIEFIQNRKIPFLGEELKSEKLISFDFGLITPYFMENDLLGFLILGPKPNNQMYTPDDILVFETLSYSTSLAIENSIYWKEIEDRHRKARLQEMDTYSYSLAHEIDNPMQIILGQTGLLQKYLLKEISLPEEKQKDIQESFNYILEAAKRVSGMVKAIRDFGQKTTGEFKLIKIEDIIESFSQLYYPQFKEKTVFFEKNIAQAKEPIFIRGEKPELIQVLVILANNSIHAMTGVKEKKVSLKVELSNHKFVKIIFSDNGYGIKKENLEIIFTPFTTTKASTEGTGMGLYNAKKIIERHKGKIWAESEGKDKGAAFFIELPIAKDINKEDFEKEDKGKRIF